MVNIPTKAKDRLSASLKKFQVLIQKAKDKDINESDTVTILVDVLAEVLGYDKYHEITSEYAVKRTYCDLAIEVDKRVQLLIEAKAVGISLKDDQIRQAVDYGANAGVDWVILTNGVTWKVYKIVFSKPVTSELIYEFDFISLSPKKQSDLEFLYYISRESIVKGAAAPLVEYMEQRQVLNHFFIGHLLVSDTLLDAIRKTLKKAEPSIRVTNEELEEIMRLNVIKRDVFEGDKSEDARKRIKKFERMIQKPKEVKTELVEV